MSLSKKQIDPSLALKLNLTGGSLSGALNVAKGTDIASATTTNIGAGTGNYINITGVTTITAFDTVQAGTTRVLNFNGVLTLTHNATSLILPTGANITTTAGDTATFVSLGSGNWVCTQYQKKSGAALAVKSCIHLEGGALNPTDSTTYYVGLVRAVPNTTASNFGFNLGFAYTITDVIVSVGANSTAGSNENSTFQIRNITQGTSSSVGTFTSDGSTTLVMSKTFNNLNINVASGDSICGQWDTPAWATNPLSALIFIQIFYKLA